MAMARQTRGRQKIPMQLIKSQDDLYASFSKRRIGLFKKAGELSTLCGADIGIIVFSPTQNLFSFFSPNMDSVIGRYFDPYQPLNYSARAIEAHDRFTIEKLNKQLDRALDQKLQLKSMNEDLDRREKGWWEEIPVESLNKEQVREWIAWFTIFKDRVEDHILQQQIGGSMDLMQMSSIHAPSEPVNLSGSGGGGDRQCYFPPALDHGHGDGESSQYIFRPPPNPYFSPQYRYYGQHDFPPNTYMGDPSRVHHFQCTSLCFSPHYNHIYAGETNEDAAEGTSYQWGNP